MGNVINKIEGSKMLSYVAIGSGLFFVGSLIWMGKEIYEAKQSAKTKALAEAELAKAAELANVSLEEVDSFSGCGGCTSSATGVKTKEKPQHDFYSSNFSGLSFRKPLKASPSYPVNVPVQPRQSCGNGGTLHWDAWGGGTKVCRGSKSTS